VVATQDLLGANVTPHLNVSLLTYTEFTAKRTTHVAHVLTAKTHIPRMDWLGCRTNVAGAQAA